MTNEKRVKLFSWIFIIMGIADIVNCFKTKIFMFSPIFIIWMGIVGYNCAEDISKEYNKNE